MAYCNSSIPDPGGRRRRREKPPDLLVFTCPRYILGLLLFIGRRSHFGHEFVLLFSLFNEFRMIEHFPYLVRWNDNGDSHVNAFCLAALLETDGKIPMTVDLAVKSYSFQL
jgi:hypothetical protein